MQIGRRKKKLLSKLKQYRPANDKQAGFMADESRFVGLNASAQSGKTFSARSKVLSRILKTQMGNGYKEAWYWIIVPNHEIAPPVKQSLREIIPNGLVDWKQQGSDRSFFNIKKGGGTLILKCGAILVFKSFATGEGLVSAPVSGIWVDEAARCNDELAWGNLFSRLNHTNGWMIMTTSPAMRAEYYNHVYRHNIDNPEFGWHSWNSYDAAEGGIISYEQIESAKRSLPKHVFEREHLASWTLSLGQVYDIFSENRHVVNGLPGWAHDWRTGSEPVTFFGLDLGAKHPTVLTVCSEYKNEYKVHESTRIVTPSLKKILEFVKEKANKWNPSWIFYDMAHEGQFFAYEWLTNVDIGLKKILYPADKRPGSVNDGISKVYWLMEEEKISFDGYGCKDLIDEILGYQWRQDTYKDEPIKENDDAVDSLRYAIATYSSLCKKNIGFRILNEAA